MPSKIRLGFADVQLKPPAELMVQIRLANKRGTKFQECKRYGYQAGFMAKSQGHLPDKVSGGNVHVVADVIDIVFAFRMGNTKADKVREICYGDIAARVCRPPEG